MVHRKEFIDRLSRKGYSKEYAAAILDNCIGVLEEALANGESVLFRGFGTFDVRDRVGRNSVDPRTKGSIHIPAYRTAHFTPGKVLKREVRSGSLER